MTNGKSPVAELEEFNNFAKRRVVTKFETCTGDTICETFRTYRQQLMTFIEVLLFFGRFS